MLQHIKEESSIKNITTNLTKSKLSFNVNTNVFLKVSNTQNLYSSSQNNN